MYREDAEAFVFLDFEASGLRPHSFPIEIGLAWIDGDAVKVWSRLIRPAGTWDLEVWDPVSQRIHGITLDELAEAPIARDVAQEARNLLAGKTPCSDAPAFDERWARRLFDELPEVFCPRVHDVHSAFDYVLNDTGMDRAYETLARSPAPHRAGPDAARYARALLQGLSC